MLIARSLRTHRLSSAITAVATALATGLVMTVFSIESQSRRAFVGGDVGFDAVLGARGSPLQLVMNAVYHLDTSPGNIPWSLYEQMKADPRVSLAIPYAVGDNYAGFRIVGTTSDLFERFTRNGRSLSFEAGGRAFDAARREAVLGSMVADRTRLATGATFLPIHGTSHEGHEHEHDEYTVVGVLAPTNTPMDRVIWIPIEGIYRMEGHVLHGTGQPFVADPASDIPTEHREVSAVMLKLRGPESGLALREIIQRRRSDATLAWPIAAVMGDLFDKLGWMSRVLLSVAYLVMLVAAAAILAALYNTMNERRREFAILRALGARRGAIFAVVIGEAAAIAGCGAFIGVALYGGLITAVAAVIREQTGVMLNVLAAPPGVWWAPLLMAALGALAGVLPAIRAYSVEVAENLGHGG
ncbi:MAG: ABC transporter permease [Phycisphaerales bacterium]|nr:ABC transporter permease [Phycisphaerales bacterium]